MTTANFETFEEVKRRFPTVEFDPDFPGSEKVFVKTSDEDIFGPEVVGLELMRQTETIRIAKVIGTGKCDQYLLVLEAIESQKPKGDFFERFARQLAEMHRGGATDQFGFEHDNFLGASIQQNAWNKDWVDFWAQNRLGFQLKLARDNGFGGREMQRLGDQLIGRLTTLL